MTIIRLSIQWKREMNASLPYGQAVGIYLHIDWRTILSSQLRMTLSKAIRWSENTWSVSIQTVVVLGARKAFNAGISELA